MKENCWEVMNCGREIGGHCAPAHGICPVVEDVTANGLNGGVNGGRICWSIAGTFCHGKVQGIFADKWLSCMSCLFYKKVSQEEGGEFIILHPDIEI